MKFEDQVKAIVPGKTYPTRVTFTEPDGKEFKFLLHSYYVGMYLAIYARHSSSESWLGPDQSSHRDQKRVTSHIKRDITSALKRGAKVDIGSIAEVVR